MKTCTKCTQYKPFREFSRDKTSKDGHSYYCKPCAQTASSKWYVENKSTIDWLDKWGWYLKRYWPEKNRKEAIQAYFIMLEKQNNVCKICNKPETFMTSNSTKIRKLSVDHCHKTGKVRGLLCNRCNKGLGQFEDNIDLLEKSLMYLKEAA